MPVLDTETKNARDLWSLDNVRVYGVISVVFVHAVEVIHRLHTHLTGFSRLAAPMGLDVFFVLSGFLVWRVTRSKSATAPLFFLHRVTRILPLYWLLTVFYIPFTAVMPLRVGHSAGVTPLHVVLSLLLVPHADSAGAIYPVLGPGWTLVFDMYFFFLFSLVLCFKRSQQFAAACLIFLVPAALHLLLHPRNVILSTYTDPRALSFLLGIVAAKLFENGQTLPLSVAKAVAVSSGLVYVGLTAVALPYYRIGIIAWIAAAFVAVYGTVSIQAAGSTWGRLPFARLVGRWSYGIYLAQVFAIPLAVLFTPGPDWLKIASAMVGSIAVGAFGHELIERPLNRALGAWEQRSGLRGRGLVTIAP